MQLRQNAFFIRAARSAVCGAALLVLLPHAQAKDEPTPLTVDANFNAAAAAAKGFTVSASSVLKGMNRVAIPVFAVEFAIADQVSSQASGFGSAGRAKSSLYYKLQGIGEAEFQAITNTLFLNFQNELKAAGFEVVPTNEVVAAPSYAKLAAGSAPAPIKSDKSMLMSAPNLGVYGITTAAAASSSKSVFGAIASAGAAMSAVGSIGDNMALGKELNAGLLEVRLNVNFVQLSDDSKGFLGRLSGTAATSGKAFPSVERMAVNVTHNSAASSINMNHTLELDSSAFADVREKATSAGDVAGAVAIGLLQLAIGSSDSSSSKELEVIADPVKYKEVVGAGLGTAGAMLVARLKTER